MSLYVMFECACIFYSEVVMCLEVMFVIDSRFEVFLLFGSM